MITVHRDLPADPDHVWALVGDLDRWAEMLPTVDEVTRTDGGGPIGVGSTFRLRQPGLSAAEYAVTAWRPKEHFTWEAAGPGVRTVATHDLVREGPGTRLTLGIAWQGPMAWLARLLFGRKVRGYVEREAATFAALVAKHG